MHCRASGCAATRRFSLALHPAGAGCRGRGCAAAHGFSPAPSPPAPRRGPPKSGKPSRTWPAIRVASMRQSGKSAAAGSAQVVKLKAPLRSVDGRGACSALRRHRTMRTHRGGARPRTKRAEACGDKGEAIRAPSRPSPSPAGHLGPAPRQLPVYVISPASANSQTYHPGQGRRGDRQSTLATMWGRCASIGKAPRRQRPSTLQQIGRHR